MKSFCKSLFPYEDFGQIEVREIDPITEKTTKRVFKNAHDLLKYKPPDDKNVYVGIYKRGYKWKNGTIDGTKANCLTTRAIYLDCDGISLNEIRANLYYYKIPDPSFIVSSGNGFHLYWILKHQVYDTEALMKAMQKEIGADQRATEKARVMRLPGSYNVKNHNSIILCEIMESNDFKYDISIFTDLFDVKVEMKRIKHSTLLLDGINTYRFCIEQMLKGVDDGSKGKAFGRHMSMGRIIKYLQQDGFKQEDTLQIILAWNERNNPPLKENDLLSSFYQYWETDYSLLGCKLPDIEQQAKLNHFCNREKCKFPMKNYELSLENTFDLNNLFFKDFKTKTGQQIIIYGLLKKYPEGLSTSQLVNKLTPKNSTKASVGKKNRSKALKSLRISGMVDVVEGNRKAGVEKFYRINPRGTFGKGYTIISNGAIFGAIDGRITAIQLKLYTLLVMYNWSKYKSPTVETLATKTGTTESNISHQLEKLENAGFIQRIYEMNEKNTEILKCRLLI
jgi:hypothetical protein